MQIYREQPTVSLITLPISLNEETLSRLDNFWNVVMSWAPESSRSASCSMAIWYENWKDKYEMDSWRIKRLGLALTRCRQFVRPARPTLSNPSVRGTFVIPLRWTRILSATARFSFRSKHAIESCRKVMAAIDSSGRRSHVRRRRKPTLVCV